MNSIEFWVACSGGADSVFLTRLLHMQGKKIGVLHCNFQLRGEESNDDAAFVKKLATDLNIPIQTKTYDTKTIAKELGLNHQETARKLRYEWFNEIFKQTKIPTVLAHHYDDQIETFVLQLLRGGSVRGLAGMPHERNGIIRPLLHIKSNEIREICLQHNWSWREDTSNQENKYKRNYIRNEFLPALEAQGFNLDDFFKTANAYAQLLSCIKLWKPPLSNQLPAHWSSEIWNKLPNLLKKELIREMFGASKFLQSIEEVMQANQGAKNQVNQLLVIKEAHGLSIQQIEKPTFKLELELIEKDDAFMDFKSSEILYLDASKICGDVYVRQRKNGDFFNPIGMRGKKLVSDFLKDRKIPHSRRETQPVICDENGIIGLPGFCPDERKKVTKSTKQILRVCVVRS